MRTPFANRVVTARRKLAIRCLAMIALAALAAGATPAGPVRAAPTPGSPQQQLTELIAAATKLSKQYADLVQRFALTNQQLKFRREQTAAYRVTFEVMRKQVARLAVVAYEQKVADSPFGLLLSASPQQVIKAASILGQQSVWAGSQVEAYLNATRLLLSAQKVLAGTEAQILSLRKALDKRLAALQALNRQEGNLLPQLTLTQLATTGHVYMNPLRQVSGLVPERVDMGADFSGIGPVYAIGAGVVTNADMANGGWPGGGWITYQLTDGPAVGEMVFLAEDVVPTVQVGQKVTPLTEIGHMTGGGDGIETGWAMPDGASSESELPECGSIDGGGPFPTAIGLNFEALLLALGTPASPSTGPAASGIVPARYQIDWAAALR